MNNDYERGYRQGFVDGWTTKMQTQPSTPQPSIPQKQENMCNVCNYLRLDRNASIGYACSFLNCPMNARSTLLTG